MRRARATASTSATVRSAPVRTTRDRAAGDATVRVEVRDLRLSHRPRIVGYAAAAPTQNHHEVRVLAFIDNVVIPFLNSLYGAVGYLGVMLAMAIESAMIPLPSELILPYAGFLVSDPSQIEPLTGQPWNFWIVVDRGDDREHARVADRVRDRRVRRPAVPRALRQVPADPAARDRAGRLRSSPGTAPRPCSSAGCCRSSGRSSASRPASPGCRSRRSSSSRRPARSSGRACWSTRARSWARTGRTSATALQPFDLAIAVVVVLAVVLFVWWRLGMPGRPGRGGQETPPADPGSPRPDAPRAA